MNIHTVFDRIFSIQLPFIHPDANSTLYRYFLIIVLALAIITLMRSSMLAIRQIIQAKSNSQTRVGVIIGSLIGVFMLVPILFIIAIVSPFYLLWWSFTTSLVSSPFIFISWLSVTLHLLASLIATFTLLLFIPGQFGIKSSWDRIIALVALGFFSLLVFGWEYFHFPIAALIVGEIIVSVFLVSWLISFFLGAKIEGAFGKFKLALFFLGMLGAIGAIWFYHVIATISANIIGVYLFITMLDGLFAALASIFDSEQANATTFILCGFKRPLLTIPLAGLLIGMAVTGVFAAVNHNIYLTYLVWIQGGSAAMVFLIFRPATDEARMNLYEEANQNEEEAYRGSRVIEALEGIVQPKEPTRRIIDAHPPAQNVEVRQQPEPQNDINDQLGDIREAIDYQRRIAAIQLQIFNNLNFQSFFIFLIAAVVYHFLISNTNFSSSLTTALVPSIGAGISLISSILPIVSIRELQQCSSITIRLLLIIMALTGLSLWLSFVPIANTPLNTTMLSLTSWQDSHFVLATINQVVRELIILMTIGQLIYLYQINNVVIAIRKMNRKLNNGHLLHG